REIAGMSSEDYMKNKKVNNYEAAYTK
ncbi:MAG: hypothetical protein K0R09_1514, partial [Clostridiales bacterium]|nr:hypothetical protein [Clostridiales bacterium]